MRRFLLFALVLAGSAGLACDGAAPTAPGGAAAQYARMSAPTFVPIKGEAELAVDPTGGLLPCYVPGTDIVATMFPARFTSEGQFSHLGRTTSVIQLLACTANADGTVSGPGTAVHTAANGDALYAEWTGTFAQDGSSALTIAFTGGTGRFMKVTGEGTGGGLSDPATFAGTWWFEGMISRIGAK
jgi:hypothetical protein